MARVWSLDDLDGIPRLGWLREPSPVTALPGTAAALGLAFLGVKRDDLIEPLHGGSKPRKLDYVLASPRYAGAPVWAHAGGIGSGGMVALTAAAAELGRQVDANLFWTETSPEILENLAFIASGPTLLHYYGSRVALALRRPRVFGSGRSRGIPVIPPGATTPEGMVGLVRAGLELGLQVRAGELPEPDRIYVAFGSGGTAVGLAMGLAMAGLRTSIVAVAAVERALSPRARVGQLQRALRHRLEGAGLTGLPEPAALRLDHGHLGAGYAASTREGLAACAALAEEGLGLEPAYTGKAMAALLADARRPAARGQGARAASVLFWLTCRRGPLPSDPAFAERLPPALARRLAVAASPSRVSRRRLVVALGAGAVAAGLGVRLTGSPELPGWAGSVLSAGEASVVTAAAEALLPPAPLAAALESLAARVDRFLAGMPARVLRDVHRMLAVIEQGTPLGGRFARFTRLTPSERLGVLERLEARGGLLAQACLGLRDLCLLAYYAHPSTWESVGYEGPRVPLSYEPRGRERLAWPAYDALVAPPGALPRGLVS